MKNLVEEKLKGTNELNIKRLYLPFVYKKKCKCGNDIELNLNNDYLMYPKLNTIEQMSIYCDKCDTQYQVDIQLEVAIVIRDEDNILMDEGVEV